jgi:hypothetical protein
MNSILSDIVKLFPDIKDPTVQSDFKKFFAALICVFISGYAIYTATNSPTGLTSQFYMYSIFVILPIVVGIFILSSLFNTPMNLGKLYYAAGVIGVISVAMYMFYRVINPQSVSLVTNLLVFLFGLAVIVGLAIVYRIFVRTIVNMRGFGGFILRILFLLPCLLMNLMESLFAELKSTPKMIVALFVLEILVILAYLYVLPLVKKPAAIDAINLLDNPTFLTQKITVGTYDQIASKPDNPTLGMTDGNGNPLKRIHYSISMWIYINPQPNSYSSKYPTDIFRYGIPFSNNGHLRVVYFNDSSSADNIDKCIVYTSVDDETGTRIKIPLQSWNQLVVVYGDTSVDIFVNGDLVATVANNNNGLNLSDGDVMESGYGDNSASGSGVYGAICNITYYKRPLAGFEVAAAYNLNRYRNPPTYN